MEIGAVGSKIGAVGSKMGVVGGKRGWLVENGCGWGYGKLIHLNNKN